jgi:hypothetical protein
MIKMSSTRKKCSKHEGMTVSFVAEPERCPVCVKDERMGGLQLNGKFLALYFCFGMDWVRVISYRGIDRAERERTIEKVRSGISNPGIDLNQTVEILEEYYKVRKNYSWSA